MEFSYDEFLNRVERYVADLMGEGMTKEIAIGIASDHFCVMEEELWMHIHKE